MKRKIPGLQELAKFMRDVAYADDMTCNIDWNLYVVHPETVDGIVGFHGGLWHRSLEMVPEYKKKDVEKSRKDLPRVSISFSYDELNGIYDFDLFKGGYKYAVNRNPSFDEFKSLVIKEFQINKLFGEE